MSATDSLLETANKVLHFFYDEIKIKPKYIIFCNGDKKKTVYQSVPKEIKSHTEDNIEFVHQTYIQNAINIDDDIENYTHAIIVDENNKEHIFNKEFLLKNMFNNIHNTTNKEYVILKVTDIPIKIEETYNKNEEKHQCSAFDKKKHC